MRCSLLLARPPFQPGTLFPGSTEEVVDRDSATTDADGAGSLSIYARQQLQNLTISDQRKRLPIFKNSGVSRAHRRKDTHS